MNYYNDNNPDAASWLRELIKAGEIAPGVVDERSILNVIPHELSAYSQCHFFAGIGGWSLALRLAGWPDEAPVWTGSCPCQPFSVAGKRKVDKDERNLWPAFRAGIAICKPAIVFGEQVASADGRVWLAGVRTDLEEMGYVLGGADLCAAGVSAPHIRQRLYWVGHANSAGRTRARSAQPERRQRNALPVGTSQDDGLANGDGYHAHWWSGPLQVGRNCIEGEVERGGRKYRAQWRTQPGLSMLADGIPGRMAQVCGFGNAIVPQLAAEFIQAACESFR